MKGESRLFLAIVAVVVTVVVVLSVGALDTAHRLTHAEQGFCDRLQRVRHQVNRNSGTIYAFLLQEADHERGRAEEYQRLKARIYYLPPTDCVKAIDDPEAYVLPPAIPWSKDPERFSKEATP
jgi:hypothetical protein